jgi:flagellar motor switch protein FliG
VLLLALGPDYGKPIFEELDELEVKPAVARHGPPWPDHPGNARRPDDRVRHHHFLQRHAIGQYRHHRAPAAELPAAGRGRFDHGRDPRPGRPQHVGKALQRAGRRSRQPISRTNIPRPSPWCCPRSPPTTRPRCSPCCPKSWRWTWCSACSALDPVQKEILEKIETTLRTEFMSTLSHTKRRDSHEQMAEIFNSFDRQTEARFITTLEEHNRDDAERIKALMFTFEDLAGWKPRRSRRCSEDGQEGTGAGAQGRQRHNQGNLLQQHVRPRRPSC